MNNILGNYSGFYSTSYQGLELKGFGVFGF